METFLVGSRGYRVHEDKDDWDYLAIIPEDQVEAILSKWRSMDHIRVEEVKGLLVPATYRVRGHDILGSSKDNQVDSILVIPRPPSIGSGAFILSNSILYTLVNLIPKDLDLDEVRRRLGYLKSWAKEHGFYGGAYPDGLCYLIFTINTMTRGYSLEGSMAMIFNRALYYHHILGYGPISHVATKNLQHMITYHKVDRTQLQQYRLPESYSLRLVRPLLDKIPEIRFIENDRTIWMDKDMKDAIDAWIKSAL